MRKKHKSGVNLVFSLFSSSHQWWYSQYLVQRRTFWDLTFGSLDNCPVGYRDQQEYHFVSRRRWSCMELGWTLAVQRACWPEGWGWLSAGPSSPQVWDFLLWGLFSQLVLGYSSSGKPSGSFLPLDQDLQSSCWMDCRWSWSVLSEDRQISSYKRRYVEHEKYNTLELVKKDEVKKRGA